jgi:hypothetical protein
MPNLNTPQLRIDDRSRVTTGGGGSPIETGGAGSAPSVTIPAAPSNLTITSTALAQSAVTPRALANLQWTPPRNVPVAGYIVEWSTSSSLDASGDYATPGGIESLAADRVTTAVGNLPCGQTVHFHIATVAKGGVQGAYSASVSALTPSDTTPPDAPTAITWTWQRTGDLLLAWTNPLSANFRDVEIQVYADATKTVHYTTAYSSTGRYTWSLSENLRATSNNPDTAVYVELRSRSYGGVFSGVAAPDPQPSKAPPATPTGVAVDFASPDANFRWDAGTDAVEWRLTLDSATYDHISANNFTYNFERNKADHGGTAADPSLSYSLVALDGLGQPSAAATGTATNPAPAAATITALGGFSTLAVTIVPPPSIRDLLHYLVRIYRNGALARTIALTETFSIIDTVGLGSGSYRADVIVVDVFNQQSAPSSQTSAVTLEDAAAFAASLRASAKYSDSVGYDPDDLKDHLADGVLDTGGASYEASASWKWTQLFRELEDRIEPVILAVGDANIKFVIATSLDGTTWRWFGSPATADGSRYVLTETTEAEAFVDPPVTGPTGATRFDFPALIPARYVRVYHYPLGGMYTLREFYAERVVEADLIRAHSIKTLHLAAASITADLLAASAVTAGKIAATAIDGKVITGATIRTAASGQRVVLDTTGLKTYDTANNVVTEASTATSGGLLVRQYRTDNSLYGQWTVDGDAGERYQMASDQATGTAYHIVRPGGSGRMFEVATSIGGGGASYTVLNAEVPSGDTAGLYLRAGDAIANTFGFSTTSQIVIRNSAASGSSVAISAAAITATHLNVGAATGAATGEVRASGRLYTQGSTAANACVISSDSGLSNYLYLYGSNTDSTGNLGAFGAGGTAARTLRLQPAGGGVQIVGNVGFFNATPAAKPTVTGSREGNAALASLISALAGLGLIADTTS